MHASGQLADGSIIRLFLIVTWGALSLYSIVTMMFGAFSIIHGDLEVL